MNAYLNKRNRKARWRRLMRHFRTSKDMSPFAVAHALQFCQFKAPDRMPPYSILYMSGRRWITMSKREYWR